MSLTVQYKGQVTLTETLTNLPFSPTASVTSSGMDTSLVLRSTGTPPISKSAALQIALTAGAHTIDLTSMVGTAGAAVDGTGLKVQLFKAQNPIANTHTLTIQPGASNGYNLMGAASKVILNPGEEFTWLGANAAAAVAIASGAKTIDLAGYGTETHNIMIVMG